MAIKAIALVRDLIPGDEVYLADLDINLIDDILNDIIDADFALDCVLPKDSTSGALFDLLTQAVADELMSRAGVTITRYEVLIPGWNALRLSGANDLDLMDDFLSRSTVSGEIGELGWESTFTGTGTLTATSASDKERPGRYTLSSGNTSGSSARIWLSEFHWDDIGELTFIAETGANIFTMDLRMGMTETAGGNLFYLFNSGTNLTVRVVAPSILFNIPTFLTLTTNTRYKFQVTRIGPNEMRLYLETSAGQVWQNDVTSFTYSNPIRPFFSISNNSTGARTLTVDYWRLRGRAGRG